MEYEDGRGGGADEAMAFLTGLFKDHDRAKNLYLKYKGAHGDKILEIFGEEAESTVFADKDLADLWVSEL